MFYLNKRLLISLFILVTISVHFGMSEAYIVGGRPIGMGNAFAGQADDASAIFINPSGISEIKTFNLLSLYSNLSSGFDYTSIAATRSGPLGGVFGVGYQGYIYPNFSISNEVLSYGEQELMLTYAKRVAEDLALGANFRYIWVGFSKDFPGLEDLNGNGYALDLGFKYYYNPWLTVGVCVQNIERKIVYKDGHVTLSPLNLIFGTSYYFLGKRGYFNNKDQEAVFNLDISKLGNENALLHTGFEYWPVKFLALRLGTEQSHRIIIDPVTEKSGTYTHFSAGVGLKLGGFTLDYAAYKSGDPSQAMTNFFSLGYVEPIEEEEEEEVVVTPSPTPEPVVARAVKRVHFLDVPGSYWASEPIELLATAGLIYGYPDNTFHPEETVGRSEFCLILLNAKHLAPALSAEELAIDLPPTGEAACAAKVLIDLGAISIYPDRTFKPERPMSRAEAVYALAVLDKLEIPKKIEKSSFKDVMADSWAAPAIEAALKAGIVAKGAYFYPYQSISRAALAQMIYNTSFGKAAIKRLPRLVD